LAKLKKNHMSWISALKPIDQSLWSKQIGDFSV